MPERTPTLLDTIEALKSFTNDWDPADPRWDALQTVADYYQSLPTPEYRLTATRTRMQSAD